MKHSTLIIPIFLTFGLLCTPANSQIDDCIKQYSIYDTVSINGNFIKYQLKHKYITEYNVKNDYIAVEYGNKSFHGSLPDKYECQTADSWIPKFEWDTHDFMILTYGCGSPCWGILVLRFDSVNPIRNIMYDMAFDYENNLVVYLDCDNYSSIIIENLKTSQARRIEFPFKSDHGEFIGAWIEDVSIKNDKLKYKYSDPNVDYDKRTWKEVTIDINL